MSESQNIEYKQSWHDDYLKWVCAFANTLGGQIFIGKDDAGNTVHLKDYKSLMELIPTKIRDLLGIICDVQLCAENEKNFIIVKVHPYELVGVVRTRVCSKSV